jgi:hypothetical protein
MIDPAGMLERIGLKLSALSTLLALHEEVGGVALMLDDITDEIGEVACVIRNKSEKVKNGAKNAQK